MRLNIRGAVQEHNFTVEVEPEWTVLRLKEAIASTINLPDDPPQSAADRIRLISMARVMDASQTLASYRLEDGQTVHMVVRQGPGSSPQLPAAPPAASAASAIAGLLPPQLQTADIMSQFFGAIPQVFQTIQQAVVAQQQSNAGGAPTATVSGVAGGAPLQTSVSTGAPTTQVPLATPAPPAPPNIPPQVAMFPGAAIHPLSRGPPPVAGVYLHLHVNMEELEALPERLTRLSQRMPMGGATFNVHPVVGGPMPPPPHVVLPNHHHHHHPHHPLHHHHPPPQQQPSAYPTPTAVAPTPPTQAQQTSASSGAAPPPPQQQAASAPSNSAATSTGAAVLPRPTLAQLVAQSGGGNIADEHPETLLDVLSKHLLSTFSVPDVMMLINGLWMPLEKLRDPARRYVMEYLEKLPPSFRQGREGRQRLAAETARSLVQAMVDHPEVHSLIRPRQRAGVNLFQQLENMFYHAMTELVDLLLDGGSGAAFTGPLRQLTVRTVGRLLFYSQRELLNRGGEDLDFIVQNLLRIGISAAAREQPQFQAQLQAMGPMAMGIATNTLAMWQQEYVQRIRQSSSDDAVFGREPPRFAPLPTADTPAAAPAAAEQSQQVPVDLDAMLDEVLEDGANSTATAQATTGSPNLRRSLAAVGIADEELDGFLVDLRSSTEPAATAAPASQEDPSAHSDVYRELC